MVSDTSWPPVVGIELATKRTAVTSSGAIEQSEATSRGEVALGLQATQPAAAVPAGSPSGRTFPLFM